MASGLTPSRIRRWATGEMTFVQKARKRSIMAAAGYRPRPTVGSARLGYGGLGVVEHRLEGQLGGPHERRVVGQPGGPDHGVGPRGHQAAALEGVEHALLGRPPDLG